MNRNYWLALMGMILTLAFCACGGGDDGDSDGDVDGESALKAFTEVCTADAECSGNFCYLGNSASYCTMACYSDDECMEARPAGQVFDACCRKVEGQNLCLYAEDCGGVDGDEENDGDLDDEAVQEEQEPEVELAEGQLCDPGKYKCEGSWIMRCLPSGQKWEEYVECVPPNICQGGQCVLSEDGDAEDICAGDVVPAPVYGTAESKWNQAKSSPMIAEIYQTVNSDQFGDQTYVRLNSADNSEEAIGQKLAFNLDIDTSYYYDIYIDYVKKANWGEAALYLDDQPDPIFLTSDYHPNSRISLHDPNLTGTGQEQKLKNVTYEPVCIPAGEHILYVKVYGKESNSAGYTLGVDYIAALPHITPIEEDGDQ